jgi:hypothetical protein
VHHDVVRTRLSDDEVDDFSDRVPTPTVCVCVCEIAVCACAFSALSVCQTLYLMCLSCMAGSTNLISDTDSTPTVSLGPTSHIQLVQDGDRDDQHHHDAHYVR